MLTLKFLYILLQSELARGILFAVAGFQQDVKIFLKKCIKNLQHWKKIVPLQSQFERNSLETQE